MQIKKIPFSAIAYETRPYPESLKQSLKRMGLGFPIKVRQTTDGRIQCIDGQKRCSAIADILKEDADHKLQNITIRFEDARSASTQPMNHH